MSVTWSAGEGHQLKRNDESYLNTRKISQSTLAKYYKYSCEKHERTAFKGSTNTSTNAVEEKWE